MITTTFQPSYLEAGIRDDSHFPDPSWGCLTMSTIGSIGQIVLRNYCTCTPRASSHFGGCHNPHAPSFHSTMYLRRPSRALISELGNSVLPFLSHMGMVTTLLYLPPHSKPTRSNPVTHRTSMCAFVNFPVRVGWMDGVLLSFPAEPEPPSGRNQPGFRTAFGLPYSE